MMCEHIVPRHLDLRKECGWNREQDALPENAIWARIASSGTAASLLPAPRRILDGVRTLVGGEIESGRCG